MDSDGNEDAPSFAAAHGEVQLTGSGRWDADERGDALEEFEGKGGKFSLVCSSQPLGGFGGARFHFSVVSSFVLLLSRSLSFNVE